MATIDDDSESKLLNAKIDCSKNETAKCNSTKTPINNRKIVPCVSTRVPEIAWNISSGCDIENNTIVENVDIPFKNIVSDEEMHSLYTSKSDLDLLSHDNMYANKQNSLEICKYVPIPNTDMDGCKFNRHYKHLTSSDSTMSPYSNHETNGIMKNVKNKIKMYPKIYLIHKYFPYFIIIASFVEIGVYFWGNDDVTSIMMYSPHERHQVWRFISYMLLHSEWIHLTLNITIQTLLAVFLEFEQGWWRCAIIYLGGGISGAMGTSVLQPSLYMVGASAGVYALLISHIANVAVKFSSIKYKNFRLFSVFVLAGFDVTYTIYHSFTNHNSQPKIGWSAHCAGAIAGIALGLLIYKGKDRGNVYIKIATVVISTVFLIYVVGSIIYNIFYSVIS